VGEPELSFAGLLRQLRAGARLTQEELAEAAGLSPEAVSALERGIHRTARKNTALLLAGALGLEGPVRGLFVAVARGKAPAADVLTARQGVVPGAFAAAPTRALPRDIAAFTGRQAELAELLRTLATAADDGGVVEIHAIDGMAGIGKTTPGAEYMHARQGCARSAQAHSAVVPGLTSPGAGEGTSGSCTSRPDSRRLAERRAIGSDGSGIAFKLRMWSVDDGN
jgi:transcriptional regulator with XRE-family HTH domain